MSEQFFTHEVQIDCDPELVFEYVTNINKWHEWYPSSQPSNKLYQASEVGQKFEIVTEQKPIMFLPFSIRKTLDYTVSKTEYASFWEVNAYSNLVDSKTAYILTPVEHGTLFRREFTYITKSWLTIIEPILLRKSIRRQASMGLSNLKTKVEQRNV